MNYLLAFAKLHTLDVETINLCFFSMDISVSINLSVMCLIIFTWQTGNKCCAASVVYYCIHIRLGEFLFLV